MEKVAGLGSSLFYLLSASAVLATHGGEHIQVNAPPQGYSDIGAFITNIFSLAFVVAVLVVLVMLIWGAFEWITSGGDKEHVAGARNRIINALIGLAVLAVAFALGRLAAQFLGFNIFNLPIPTPPPTGVCPPGLNFNAALGRCV